MDYYIVYVDSVGLFEYVTAVRGNNALVRAKEYAKQILAPDKKEVRVVSWEEYTANPVAWY